MKSRATTKHPDMGFQIAPMIDVVFVIMLYFMVMAGSARVEHELRMKLPGGAPKPGITTEIPDELTISVAENGQVRLNDSPVDNPTSRELPTLTRDVALLAQNAKRARTQLLVTVSAEETSRYERTAQVLNALALAGAATNVTFAVADVE